MVSRCRMKEEGESEESDSAEEGESDSVNLNICIYIYIHVCLYYTLYHQNSIAKMVFFVGQGTTLAALHPCYSMPFTGRCVCMFLETCAGTLCGMGDSPCCFAPL